MKTVARRSIAGLRPLLVAAFLWLALGATASAGGKPPTLVAQPGVTAPASISDLARALKYDVNLIYEYVYTNIEYSPTWGLKKGALGTLLDGYGNDFDQSALLVALLRASGYTAQYRYGVMHLDPTAIGIFYNVTTPCGLASLLNGGDIPFVLNPTNCHSGLSSADIDHVWVSATGGSLGSTTVLLDPSFKTYDWVQPIGLSSMGYDQASFLTAAKSGAAITADYIQNLNSSNIASSLTTYANSLVNYIRTSNPTATTRDIMGGSYIQPLAQPYALPTSLPYTELHVWDEIPIEYRTTLRIQIEGIDKTYFGDEIYGHRLSIVYSGTVPVLYLDGVAQGTGAAGANTISYAVDLPRRDDLYAAQNVVQAKNGFTYAIVAGWDVTGRGMVEFHRRQLQANRAAGSLDSSEAVLGEALNMIGYSWLAQLDAASAITDRIVGSKIVVKCAVGVVAQVDGPYIDMPGVLIGAATLSNDTNLIDTAFFSFGGMLSALEWGALEQNLGRGGVGAVSTIKLLDVANAQHKVIFDATSANWTSVSGQIDYYPSDFSQAAAYIGGGYRLVLPQDGKLVQGAWQGAGYVGVGPSSTPPRQITYKISSNLKGGYSTQFVSSTYTVSAANFTGAIPLPVPQFSSYDPIDLSSGAFLYDRDDLALGPDDFPIGLKFNRSYNSNNLYAKSPLGLGWTHNFSITALSNSDGLKGMGQDSPIDGAAAIVAMYVAQDLFSDPAKPFDKVLIASLVQKWLMDRLINNTVVVTKGSQAEQFVLLADGSYNPQPGSSSRLSLDGGTYTFKDKDATTLTFDTNGNLSTWVVPSGVTASFGYDASSPPLLTSVSNGLGRTLALAYNGAKQLTSVNDNAGRSVSYAYDSNGNLASVVDTLGFTTTFGYTPAGGASPAGLLAQIFTPTRPGTAFVTNTYGMVGRVATQTNANGATWSYFLAGYRSEEVDPNGTRHLLFYNPRGKARFDIQDYAGLYLVTRLDYDGLDRLVSTTLPGGYNTTPQGLCQPAGPSVDPAKDCTRREYETSVNPWANNIKSVTRVGTDSSETVTAYVYDPTINKPTAITGPWTSTIPSGQVTTLAYDPANGNVAAKIADSTGLKARTRYSYTGLGQVASMTDPVGTVTIYSYDAAGNRLSMVEDAGPGRLNRTTLYGYDPWGDVISVTDPRGNVTTSTYDAARRLVTTTSPATAAAPGGVVTTNSYDAEGRLLQAEQSAGGTVLRTTSSTWTPTGKLASATDANGNVTLYQYDLLDRQVTLTDAMGRVTEFTYDNVSRPRMTYNRAIQPATAMLEQTWTDDGKLASVIDANTNTTTYHYDQFNRLDLTTWPDGSTETSTYDQADNVVKRTSRANGTFTLLYDTLYRVIRKTPPSGPVVDYGYDLAGRQTGVSDNSNPIALAFPPGGSTVTYTTTYTYDALNRPTGASWDPAPAAIAPTAGTLVSIGHSYDRTNRRIGQTVDDSTWLYYPTGPPSTLAYTPNALNQYSSVGGAPATYDANGNLTSDSTRTYGYDAENRMVSVNSGAAASYAYDAQGRRKSRTIAGTTTISVTDTDNREVLEYDGGTGAVLRWYAYGAGANDVLSQINVPAATRTTVLPDLQGSIIATISSAGTLTKSAYQAYGTSAAAASPFGYTGQRLDAEAGGLYYYRARHYSPVLGRFLQTDPVGYKAGYNLYAYVKNDPLNATDPTGLAPGLSTTLSSYSYWSGSSSSSFASESNIAYRGISAANYETIQAGQGIAASAPSGVWSAEEHISNSGPGFGGAAANSPWISTSRLLDVAQAYNSGYGVVAIDLSLVNSLQVEVWQTAQRINGVGGLPYFRSLFGQEVTIYNSIPQNAIIGFIQGGP